MFKEKITEKHCMLLIIIAMHLIGCRPSGGSKLKPNTKTESSTKKNNQKKEEPNNTAYIDPHKEVEEAPPEQSTLVGNKEAKSDNYTSTSKAKKNKFIRETSPTTDQPIADPNNRNLSHDIPTQPKQEHLNNIEINRESKDNPSNDGVISTQPKDQKKKKKKQSPPKCLEQENNSKSTKSGSRSPIQLFKKFLFKNKETGGDISE